MGGFLGIGNSSAKTDRGNQLQGINATWNVYNRGLPLSDMQSKEGDATTTSGLSGVDAARQYFQKIMGGDRTAVSQAAAPAVSSVVDQEAGRKSEEAMMGTGRTGGAVASNEEGKSREEADINNIIAGVQPQAAQGAATTGVMESQVGLQQMRDALAALGLSQQSADEIVNSSIQSRPISEAANTAVRQQWSNFLDGLITGGFGGGGGTPAPAK